MDSCIRLLVHLALHLANLKSASCSLHIRAIGFKETSRSFSGYHSEALHLPMLRSFVPVPLLDERDVPLKAIGDGHIVATITPT